MSNKLTRDNMVQAIVEDVDNWPLDVLIDWIKAEMILKYVKETDSQVKSDYKAVVLGELPTEDSNGNIQL